MDHDFEIATYDRMTDNIYNKAKLGKAAAYYAEIRPTNFAREEAARAEKEAAKAAKKASA
jgi:NADH-quinone oxidoreductase subunit I